MIFLKVMISMIFSSFIKSQKSKTLKIKNVLVEIYKNKNSDFEQNR